MIFHLKKANGFKKKIRSIFNTLCVEKGTKRSLIEKLCLTFLANQNLCLHCESSLLCQQCCCSCFLSPANCYALDSCQLCMCVYICAVQATISLARCRYIDSFTHITLLSAPLAPLFCSCAVHLTVICSFTHTPCRAELPFGSYVYLTKNAGMPIKRAQKVFLNMEQVLWLGNTSRIATLCEKEAH